MKRYVLLGLLLIGAGLVLYWERKQREALVRDLVRQNPPVVEGKIADWAEPKEFTPLKVRAVTLDGERLYWDPAAGVEGRVGRFEVRTGEQVYVVWVQIPPEPRQ